MDQRYDFEERIKRIERKVIVDIIFFNSLVTAVGGIIFIAMHEVTVFLAILAFITVVAATPFLIYREMDEVSDEDIPALIQKKVMHVVFVIIAIVSVIIAGRIVNPLL